MFWPGYGEVGVPPPPVGTAGGTTFYDIWGQKHQILSKMTISNQFWHILIIIKGCKHVLTINSMNKLKIYWRNGLIDHYWCRISVFGFCNKKSPFFSDPTVQLGQKPKNCENLKKFVDTMVQKHLTNKNRDFFTFFWKKNWEFQMSKPKRWYHRRYHLVVPTPPCYHTLSGVCGVSWRIRFSDQVA